MLGNSFSPTAKLMAVSVCLKGSFTAGTTLSPLYWVMGDVATIRSVCALLSVLALKTTFGTFPSEAFILTPLVAPAAGKTA